MQIKTENNIIPIVEFSEPAKADLIGIWQYIGANNPLAADKIIDELLKKFQVIAQNPKMGRARPELTIELRSFPHKKYLIFYFEIENGIEIFRVISAEQDVDTIFDDYFEGLSE